MLFGASPILGGPELDLRPSPVAAPSSQVATEESRQRLQLAHLRGERERNRTQSLHRFLTTKKRTGFTGGGAGLPGTSEMREKRVGEGALWGAATGGGGVSFGKTYMAPCFLGAVGAPHPRLEKA